MDPYNEQRLYAFDKHSKDNALTYLSSENLNTGGAVAFSHDDKYLAATLAPGRFIIDPITESYVPYSLSPSIVVTMTFLKKENKFDLEYIQPASPSNFGLGWSPNDKLLLVAGLETPAQKNTQLYRVITKKCEEDRKDREECGECKKEKCECEKSQEEKKCGCKKEKCGCEKKRRHREEKSESESSSSSSSSSSKSKKSSKPKKA